MAIADRLFEYRLNDCEDKLKALRENSHKTNTALLKQGATLDKIIEDSERLYQKACDNSSRLDDIEKRFVHDDAVKETKNKIIKGIFEHWKVLSLTVFIVFDLFFHGVNMMHDGSFTGFLNAIKSF